jgi:hypothetical protein
MEHHPIHFWERASQHHGLVSILRRILRQSIENAHRFEHELCDRDAFLVGQATVSEPTNPFYGFRITLGLNGNDPVVFSMPEASVVGQLLAGLGMMGRVVGARRRHAVRSDGQCVA